MIDNNSKGQNRQTRQNSQAHIARKSVFPICAELASKTAIPRAQRKLLCLANLRNPVWPECITFCCFLCSPLPAPCSSRSDRTKRNYFLLLFLLTVHCSPLPAPWLFPHHARLEIVKKGSSGKRVPGQFAGDERDCEASFLRNSEAS